MASKFKKFPVGLFPPAAILAGARSMAVGSEKHGGEYNWREVKPESLTGLIDGIMRHALALRDGEDLADDGETHYGHILARAAIIADGYVIDDRPTHRLATGADITAWEMNNKKGE